MPEQTSHIPAGGKYCLVSVSRTSGHVARVSTHYETREQATFHRVYHGRHVPEIRNYDIYTAIDHGQTYELLDSAHEHDKPTCAAL